MSKFIESNTVGSHIFGRHTRVQNPVAVSGKGAYLIDHTGKRYLDACGGAAVSCLGHGHVAVLDQVSQQLTSLAYAHTGFFSSEPAEALADELISLAPEGIDRVYFVSGGSEAVEASLKLSRQYFLEKGEGQRQFVIARWQSYHGNTLGALATGGNAWRRQQFQPFLSDSMHHIDPCYYWRWSEPGETPEAYARRCADQLEEKILELGEQRVAAFIAEPVVGATLGAVAAEFGYFARIREICDKYGVLLILDEVMCGMGRTGSLFASEQENIAPDIVCIAKGLAGGFQPLGAMLCSSDIYQSIADGSGFFQHGHTYLAHPAACAAGLAVVRELCRPLADVMSDDNLALEASPSASSTADATLVHYVAQQGPLLLQNIKDKLQEHPNVGDIRGRGFFMGIELVSDRKTKAPLDPALTIHAQIKREAFSRGLLIYPMGGTVDGKSGDHILLAPPFIASATVLDELVEKLAATINAVLPP